MNFPPSSLTTVVRVGIIRLNTLPLVSKVIGTDYSLPFSPTLVGTAPALTLVLQTINPITTTVDVIMKMREQW